MRLFDAGHEAEEILLGGLGAGDFGNEAALAEDEDAGGEVEELGEFGGDEEDGEAGGGEAVDELVDGGFGADVHAAGGFVDYQDFAVAGEPFG